MKKEKSILGKIKLKKAPTPLGVDVLSAIMGGYYDYDNDEYSWDRYNCTCGAHYEYECTCGNDSSYGYGIDNIPANFPDDCFWVAVAHVKGRSAGELALEYWTEYFGGNRDMAFFHLNRPMGGSMGGAASRAYVERHGLVGRVVGISPEGMNNLFGDDYETVYGHVFIRTPLGNNMFQLCSPGTGATFTVGRDFFNRVTVF